MRSWPSGSGWMFDLGPLICNDMVNIDAITERNEATTLMDVNFDKLLRVLLKLVCYSSAALLEAGAELSRRSLKN